MGKEWNDTAEKRERAELPKVVKAIAEAIPLGLNLWDANLNNIACNQQALNVFGAENEAEYLREFHTYSPEYQPNGQRSDDLIKLYMQRLKEDGSCRFKWMHLDSNGRELPAEITLSKVSLTEGEDHVVGFVRDLREEFGQGVGEEAEEFYFPNHIPQKVFLSKVAEISDDLFFAIDRRSKTIQFLGKHQQNAGVDGINAMSAAYNEEYVHEDDVEEYRALVQDMAAGIEKPHDMRFLQKGGGYRYYRIVYRFIYNEKKEPIIVVGKGIDIGEQKVLEEKTKFDSLTQCYSRVNVEALIEKRVAAGKVKRGALVLVDLDRFKDFNEKNGHFYGDEVLRQLAERLKEWSEEKDIVGRVGGDEFVVYVNCVEDKEAFAQRLELLHKGVNERYQIFGFCADISVSMGVAFCEDNRFSYEVCLQSANRAVYAVKSKGGGAWQFCDTGCEGVLEDESALRLIKEAKANKIAGLHMDHMVISAVFNLLYERNSDKMAVASALRYLGQHFDVSRCFIAESLDEGESYRFTHEWCEQGVSSHIQQLGTVPAELLQGLFGSALPNGTYICENVEDCSIDGALTEAIKRETTKAFLHAQIKKEDVVLFFIGMEDCKRTRVWKDVEINTLQYLARILSVILQGKHLDEEVKVLGEYSKISAFVADNTDNFIYIVDPETFDILHMNKRALGMYNNPPEAVWRTKKCYDLLHEKTEPCEFCTNQYVTENAFYEWTYYNPRFQKTYLFKDKLVPLGSKMVKLQVATDITKMVGLEAKLTDKLEEQDLLLECIRMLHTGGTPDASIKRILGIVGAFFGVSRAVILRVREDGLSAYSSHEWTSEHTEQRKHDLQNLPMEALAPFFERVGNKRAEYLPDFSNTFANQKELIAITESLGIKSVLCAPILDANGAFMGIFSLENVEKNIDKYWLLGSLSVFVSDFLEKNHLISQLNKLSYYDTLTGAKNRHSYRRALHEIDEAKVSSLGVAYVDITGLARINEEKGTRYGDEMVKRMSHILSEIFSENFFRVGGDEFVVLEKNVQELAFEGKINVLKDAIFQEEELNASVGFTWNSDFEDEDEDEMGEYNTVWDSQNYTAILSKNLEKEIKRGKYAVYLQPQINFQTGELDGAEALIRRIDASGNVQSPAYFVPFYEKEGMISQIDLHVFETVCRLLRHWKECGVETDIKFSVNCSRSTIMEKDIVSKLSSLCEKYGVSKSRFVVEITETIRHTDDRVFSYVITSLKNAGFCVSLDDFGSGHSNLCSLRMSDFDEIKIDMGLTREVHLEAKSRILTKAVLNLCEEFPGMVSVAEGIETVEQYHILKDLHCQKGQGYYFSKPICIKEFEQKYFEDLS